MMKLFAKIVVLISLFSCSGNNSKVRSSDLKNSTNVVFYLGADLSYVNEMEDCGAVYKDRNGKIKDPYGIFKAAGANLIRLRLWHNPDWTTYSNFTDIKKSIKRAKTANLKVLLDFHYSDTWADPSRQLIPTEWLDYTNDVETLGKLIYNYTYNTLDELSKDGLLPDIVQVGNEINTMILQKEESNDQQPINWERNAKLINKGIQAVRDISKALNKEIEVMLHIAQPENALLWFKEASENGVSDYDWIGVSYYPIWSKYKLSEVSSAFKTLISTYKKKLMVVETAYPFSLQNMDSADNILGNDALILGYPASQEGQLAYLQKLKEEILFSGGSGLIYWEPAWVSTSCSTLWGQGSHWDNATLFDNNGMPTLGMDFYMKNVNR